MEITKLNKKQLRDLVEKHAKYQKVILIYDKYVSHNDIQTVYEQIKEICVFNKMEITNENINEIYNGYKMIIFMCEPESFLSFNMNLEEFVNVFFSSAILPCCLNAKNTKSDAKVFILDEKSKLDKSAFSSLSFNNFYNYLANIYNQTDVEIDFSIGEISNRNLIQKLNLLPDNFEFVDIDILRKSNLNYNFLPIVDFVLTVGFATFFSDIKQHTLLMTDLYKTIKENDVMIDKFYALAHNDAMITMVELNFSAMQNNLKHTNAFVRELINENFTDEDLDNIINAIKEYSKNCTGLLNYLYLYNVFE